MSAAQQNRVRSIRDPIHGDIELSSLEAAIIGTRQFQRLRYIRQNGLLHFVFPGAVHTRFAHSLGAFHLAKRAFSHLVSGFEPGSKPELLAYLSQVFRLAALLHDVGHCAFSHSIEHVEVNGKPFFGNLTSFLNQMDDADLLAKLTQLGESADAQTKHEHVSLLLVRQIFAVPRVLEQSQDAAAMCQDIVALIDGRLSPSQRFSEAASWFIGELKIDDQVEAEPTSVERQLLSVFHSLISGTLDVDRLDYLIRDSLQCGVPYGKCEVEFLLRSLRIGAVAGRLALILDSKAKYALEDMLWSRYQLFVQVLNHKTNVALNLALKLAIEDAVSEVRIERPDTLNKLLFFTDDYVMSNIHRVAMLGNLVDRSYTKILIDRRFPRHLGVLELGGMTTESRESATQTRANELATKLCVAPKEIMVGSATSKIIKDNPLYIQSWNRLNRAYDEPLPFEYSTIQGSCEHVVAHFFLDRDKATEIETKGRTNEN